MSTTMHIEDLLLDIRLHILSMLSFSDALAFNIALPHPQQRSHLRARIRALKPLRDAWVRAGAPSLHAYANPPHLRSAAMRASVPPSIFTQLTALPLSHAHLTSLTAIHEMRSLRSLDASHNHITHAPELAACSHLRVLHLGWNQLQEFPPVLHLPELRTLLLHHNCFGKLPEEWDGVPQLYRLGLFSCGVTKLPTNLCQWLGTVTEHRRARTANLADNLLDGNEVNHLFTKFPKLKKSLMV